MSEQEARPTLMDGLRSEVSPENAPLLRFITRHAASIAGFILLLLLILGGVAVWNWIERGREQETREELARISAELKGQDRDEALLRLAENAPDNVKLFIYLSLGKSAQENGNPILAADAYAKAAEIDGDGPLGMTAVLGSAMSLLMQGKFHQAYPMLEQLAAKLPSARQSLEFKQLLAESAAHAGKKREALELYRELARQTQTPQAGMFIQRAEQLEKELRKENQAK